MTRPLFSAHLRPVSIVRDETAPGQWSPVWWSFVAGAFVGFLAGVTAMWFAVSLVLP